LLNTTHARMIALNRQCHTTIG